MMIFLFKPLSLFEGMLMMIVVLVVIGAVMMTLGFLALKVFANYINSRRDIWTETAQELGLEIQASGIIKPLKGVYQTHQVELLHESPDGERPFTVCKIFLPTAPPYGFEIDTQNYLNRMIESVFGSTEIKVGVDAFDNAFAITGYDETIIRKFLSVHLPDGKYPNLIALLLSLKKSEHFITISADTVKLQKRGEFLEINEVKPILDSAIYLIGQMQEAEKRMVDA